MQSDVNANVTYGLFHAVLEFPSDVKLREWEESFIDFDAPGVKEKLAPISHIWMDDYPGTSLFGESIGFVSKEIFTLEQALEYFTKNHLKINKEQVVKMNTTKKDDEIYYEFVFKGKLIHPLKINAFLKYLENVSSKGEEYFDIQYGKNFIEISAYLGSYETIVEYAELLFLILIIAKDFQALGQGFLIPDNYYFDFYDFIECKLDMNPNFHLECSDLQSMGENLIQEIEKVEPEIKENYQIWSKINSSH